MTSVSEDEDPLDDNLERGIVLQCALRNLNGNVFRPIPFILPSINPEANLSEYQAIWDETQPAYYVQKRSRTTSTLTSHFPFEAARRSMDHFLGIRGEAGVDKKRTNSASTHQEIRKGQDLLTENNTEAKPEELQERFNDIRPCLRDTRPNDVQDQKLWSKDVKQGHEEAWEGLENAITSARGIEEDALGRIETDDQQSPPSDYHHVNFNGEPVYVRSYTSPEVSFWAIASDATRRSFLEQDWNRRSVLNAQAAKLVDPVYLERPPPLPFPKGTQLRDAVKDHAFKCYASEGTWMSDTLRPNDDSILLATPGVEYWNSTNTAPLPIPPKSEYDGSSQPRICAKEEAERRLKPSKPMIGRPSPLRSMALYDDEDNETESPVDQHARLPTILEESSEDSSSEDGSEGGTTPESSVSEGFEIKDLPDLQTCASAEDLSPETRSLVDLVLSLRESTHTPLQQGSP